jgi:hypothetical protein
LFPNGRKRDKNEKKGTKENPLGIFTAELANECT